MAKRNGLAIFKFVALFLPFILGFTLLHILGGSVYEAQKRSSAGVEMVALHTKHFVIYARSISNYEETLANSVESFTEAFYKKFRAYFALNDFDVPVSIMLLENKKMLERYAERQLHQDLAFNGGFYNPVKKDIAIILSGDFRRDQKALFHETTHAIFDNASTNADWSSWFAEGLATYFEESVIMGAENILGGKNTSAFERVESLIGTNNFISLEDLIKASQKSFESSRNSYYYAESHTLVYFLLNDTKYKDKFRDYYLEEKKPGPCPPYAFESIFGDFEQVEKDLQQFILTKKD